MYRDLKQNFWWNNEKKKGEIVEYMNKISNLPEG